MTFRAAQDLQQTLLRISGVIQVLNELLDTSQENGSAPPVNEDTAIPVSST